MITGNIFCNRINGSLRTFHYRAREKFPLPRLTRQESDTRLRARLAVSLIQYTTANKSLNCVYRLSFRPMIRAIYTNIGKNVSFDEVEWGKTPEQPVAVVVLISFVFRSGVCCFCLFSPSRLGSSGMCEGIAHLQGKIGLRTALTFSTPMTTCQSSLQLHKKRLFVSAYPTGWYSLDTFCRYRSSVFTPSINKAMFSTWCDEVNNYTQSQKGFVLVNEERK